MIDSKTAKLWAIDDEAYSGTLNGDKAITKCSGVVIVPEDDALATVAVLVLACRPTLNTWPSRHNEPLKCGQRLKPSMRTASPLRSRGK